VVKAALRLVAGTTSWDDGEVRPLTRPDMELGHSVTGSVGHLGHLSRPGHWVIILTRCEIRVFRFSKKYNYGTNTALPGTMQILLFGAGYKYSYLLTYLVECSIRYSTEYSNSKKLDSHTPTHKSTFRAHYRTRSPGQLGLRVAVAGLQGHWVAGSQNVTQFHVWSTPEAQRRPTRG